MYEADNEDVRIHILAQDQRKTGCRNTYSAEMFWGCGLIQLAPKLKAAKILARHYCGGDFSRYRRWHSQLESLLKYTESTTATDAIMSPIISLFRTSIELPRQAGLRFL